MSTGIEWTDETLNIYTGCTRVSPGCDNCYMYAMYPRLRAMGANGYQHAPNVVSHHPERLERVMRWRQPRRVFVNSMSDTFHPDADYNDIDDIFDTLIAASERQGHIFQMLTKRPGRAAHWWKQYSITRRISSLPKGIWLGTSVESQKYAPRIEVLARIPAAVRFVSAEPLLGALDISEYLAQGYVDWVIAGGESGHNARPMDTKWTRCLLDQCLIANVPFFLKQLGGARDKRGKDRALLDGELWRQFPTAISR